MGRVHFGSLGGFGRGEESEEEDEEDDVDTVPDRIQKILYLSNAHIEKMLI